MDIGNYDYYVMCGCSTADEKANALVLIKRKWFAKDLSRDNPVFANRTITSSGMGCHGHRRSQQWHHLHDRVWAVHTASEPIGVRHKRSNAFARWR